MNPNQQTIPATWVLPSGTTHECEITIAPGFPYSYGEDADGNRGEARQDWEVVGAEAYPTIAQDDILDFEDWCSDVLHNACQEVWL